MSLQLDAREVLHELNQLGYVNITAEQLKEFMHDLKRLIKYEQKDSTATATTSAPATSRSGRAPGVDHQATQTTTTTTNNPNQHGAAAAAARPQTATTQTRRVRDQENQTSLASNTKSSCCNAGDRPATTTTASSSSARRQQHGLGRIPIPPLSAVTTATTASALQHRRFDDDDDDDAVLPLRPANNRKPVPLLAAPKLIRNTPTDLYQNYQRDWQRFRQHLPGETSRSSVRQAVRRMMETEPPPKPRVYLALYEDQTKSIRRK